jgi:hypothetical protein
VIHAVEARVAELSCLVVGYPTEMDLFRFDLQCTVPQFIMLVKYAVINFNFIVC